MQFRLAGPETLTALLPAANGDARLLDRDDFAGAALLLVGAGFFAIQRFLTLRVRLHGGTVAD